jgi:hypothetical protein
MYVRARNTAPRGGSRALLAVASCSLAALCLAPPARAAGTAGERDDVAATAGVQLDAASVVECVSSAVQAERSATFAGEMTAVAGTARMAMRIDVQEQLRGELLYHTIVAPGLGVWRTSQGKVKIYRYFKQVTDLSSPARYRALIRFRWLGPHGHVLRTAELATAHCTQKGSAPAPAAAAAVTAV